jgi:hypothetical protein
LLREMSKAGGEGDWGAGRLFPFKLPPGPPLVADEGGNGAGFEPVERGFSAGVVLISFVEVAAELLGFLLVILSSSACWWF